ncbi:hypothetical protein [Arthrobacter sp. JCM 19049]|uniref:hypothetical protein n=1 Tax=Arthrobacter sp. JCM 19049 TaxID=1460643 RepID=UPI000A633225|nr:hypothetical protein [Arthrobacter sp. JCM 19049]
MQASAEYVFAWRVLAILGCYLPALLLSSGRRAWGNTSRCSPPAARTCGCCCR